MEDFGRITEIGRKVVRVTQVDPPGLRGRRQLAPYVHISDGRTYPIAILVDTLLLAKSNRLRLL